MTRGRAGSSTPESERGRWRTPPALYASQDMQYHFDRDVAAQAHTALHDSYLTEEDDALVASWGNPGDTVWCNPPYNDIMPWIYRAAAMAGEGVSSVLLLPAAMDTAWWAEALLTVSEIVMITGGRVGFLHPVTGKKVSGNMGGSALLYWNADELPEEVKIRWLDRDDLMTAGDIYIATNPDRIPLLRNPK